MPSKLDRLIESIDPSRTLDDVSARVDEAINSFSVKRAVIEDWYEYVRFFAGFYQHVETTVLGLGPGAPDDRMFYWNRCSDLLKKSFGPDGQKAAFEMVSTGKEGGLYRVLKTVADLMAEGYAEREISARVYHYWGTLSAEQKLAAADEYLDKYGHILPSELTEGNAVWLKANLPEFLEKHPKMIRRLRRIGR